MSETIQYIPVDLIDPNPEQPRKRFDRDALAYLASSIGEVGLKQPVLVEDTGDGRFRLVSGERRLTAVKSLKLTVITAVVRPASNHGGLELLADAMAENVARDDMNPVDEGLGYLRMHDVFKLTARQISIKVGAKEYRVTHLMRLALLDPEIRELIADGRLPAGIEAVNALHKIDDKADRVKLATYLANHAATIRMVVTSVERYLDASSKPIPKAKVGAKIGKGDSPAMYLAKQANVHRKDRPEWNVFAAAGTLPPWPEFRDQVEKTCDACAIRDVASPAMCKECPLVDCVRRLMEVANVA